MNVHDVGAFLSQLKASLEKYFAEYKIEFLIKTQKSIKANIFLRNNLFIAENLESALEQFSSIYEDLEKE